MTPTPSEVESALLRADRWPEDQTLSALASEVRRLRSDRERAVAEAKAEAFEFVAKSCSNGAERFNGEAKRRGWLEAMAKLWAYEASAIRPQPQPVQEK